MVSGKVFDAESKKPLNGVQIVAKNTLKSTYTDSKGTYSLIIPEKAEYLIFKLAGYAKQEVKILGVTRVEVGMRSFSSKNIENVVMIGSRNQLRTRHESPVAVDIISKDQLNINGGFTELSQLLHYQIPSINSTRQSGADATDHVIPSSLRGMGPDQTLVLINGKKYHHSSLLNVFGTHGRATSGTDLDCIPLSMIERVEILKDGAVAQYGSGAIAGAINIVTKSESKGGELSFNTGGFFTGYGRTLNTEGGGKLIQPTFDGATLGLSANYSFKLGQKGKVTLNFEHFDRGYRYRLNNDSVFEASSDLRRVSDANVSNTNVFFNASVPIKKHELYTFGGFNLRKTNSDLWRVLSKDLGEFVSSFIDKDYYDPVLSSQNEDLTSTIGLKLNFDRWKWDISNTFGMNHLHLQNNNTLNVSLLHNSPSNFELGAPEFYQNTLNIEATRRYTHLLQGLNITVGAELKYEQVISEAGEEASYKNYSPVIKLRRDGKRDTLYLPGGAQGFPGIRPSDAIKVQRGNADLYTDIELDITDKWLVVSALRVANYTDFGLAHALKFSTRYKLTPNFIARSAFQVGYKAPNLSQISYNRTSVDYDVAGNSYDKIISGVYGIEAKTIGLNPLSGEKSTSKSLGISFNPEKHISFSIDAYDIEVKNRISITNTFTDKDPIISKLLKEREVKGIQFLANSLKTRTTGLDVVSSYATAIGSHKFDMVLAANFNKMTTSPYNIPAAFVDQPEKFINAFEISFVNNAAPVSKINTSFNYKFNNWGANLSFTRFSGVWYYNYSFFEGSNPEADAFKAAGKIQEWNKVVQNKYDPRWTTDVSGFYYFNKNLKLIVGAQNIFDVYPSAIDPYNSESGGMWESVQMGTGGAYFFTRLNFKF